MNRLLGLLVLALVLGLGVAAALLQLPQGARSSGTVEIRQALFLKSDDPLPPGDGAPWKARQLPDDWSRTNPGQSGYAWYLARFPLAAQPREGWMAYLPTVASTYRLYINGVDVGGGDMTGPLRRTSGRPQSEDIAQHLLHAGTNELLLRLRVAPNLRGGLGPIHLGPADAVEPVYDRDFFLRVTLPRSLNIALIFAGLLVLLLWLRRPRESIYGIFAALAVVWSVRNFHYTVQLDIPSAVWEAFVLGSLALIVVLHWMFMRRYSGMPRMGAERVLLLLAVLSLPALALLDPVVVSALRLPWYAGCALLGAWSVLLLVRHLRGRRGEAGPWVILGGAVVTLMLGLTDFAVSAHLLPFGPAARMAYGAPLLLCALVYALAEDYFRTYDEARALNAELERRVQERTQELERTHERLRALERVATVAGERERVMRDMHDGIGSQLITTLEAVERGGSKESEVAALLRACMDDLRLMIDSLEPDEDSLQIALANLRYRLEPRLRAAGVTLAWEVEEGVGLPTAGAALQVLRIVQEALSNVLKHAGARSVRVSCRTEAGELRLTVADDGVGLPAAGPRAPAGAQRGLQNMRLRAQQLRGDLDVASNGTGTAVTLRVPL